jgi:hypothetical protein
MGDENAILLLENLMGQTKQVVVPDLPSDYQLLKKAYTS